MGSLVKQASEPSSGEMPNFTRMLSSKFYMKKFQNMEHSNSRTFQGLSRALIFFPKIQGLSRTSQGPYEPCSQKVIENTANDQTQTCSCS